MPRCARSRTFGIRWLSGLLVVLLAGCITPYQPRSMTGGYQERELSPHRWYVEFFGNGNTTRDTVMAYWLNRCAELTISKGFDYFVFISKDPRPAAASEEIYRARGSAPSYVYIPGGTITTYSAHGTIEMGSGDPDRPHALVAREVMAKLAPLISQAMAKDSNIDLPEDFLASIGAAPPRDGGSGNQPVKLEDLKDLLPAQ